MRKIASFFVLIVFVFSCITPPCGFAQSVSALGLMTQPGAQVGLTGAYMPSYLKGMVINPGDPFKFDFIIYRGDENFTDLQKQQQYPKLIKYFLAALAVPDTDQWVNLSPYEKDRIIPASFGNTEMGRDLLAQDYLLKQLSGSLTNPDSDLGKKFWDEVYSRAYERFGSTIVPNNTFNKVWVVPDKAVIYEKGDTVYVLEQHLKVMMDKDYISTKNNTSIEANEDASKIAQDVTREIIIPAIEKEVNEGKNFAPVRQVYSSMLLAAWYKRSLKGSILGRLYADKGKVKGVDQDAKNNEHIYAKYVEAFKAGVFDMIKEDHDRYTQQVIPRRYFSGGMLNVNLEKAIKEGRVTQATTPQAQEKINAETTKLDRAQVKMDKVERVAKPAFSTAEVGGQPVVIASTLATPGEKPQVLRVYVGGEGAPFQVIELEDANKNEEIKAFKVDAGGGRAVLTDGDGTRSFSRQGNDFISTKGEKLAPIGETKGKKDMYMFTAADGSRPVIIRIEKDGKVNAYDALKKAIQEKTLNDFAKIVAALPAKATQAFMKVMANPADTAAYNNYTQAVGEKGTVATPQEIERIVTSKPLGNMGSVVHEKVVIHLNQAGDAALALHQSFLAADILVKVQDSAAPEKLVKELKDAFDASYSKYESLVKDKPEALARDGVMRIVTGRDAVQKTASFEKPEKPVRPEIAKMVQEETIGAGKTFHPAVVAAIEKEAVEQKGFAAGDEVKKYVAALVERAGLVMEHVKQAGVEKAKEGIVAALAITALGTQEKVLQFQNEISVAKGELVAAPEAIALELSRPETVASAVLRAGDYLNQAEGLTGSVSGVDNVEVANNLLIQDRQSLLIALRPVGETGDLGGIDFNATNIDLQIKRDGHGVPLPVSQQDLDNIRIDGLVPVILGIQPVASAPILQ